MVDPMATVALETLRDLLIEKVKFLPGVSGQVEEVSKNLRIMHRFLIDADRTPAQYNSEKISNWVTKLRALASDAEDVLDQYPIEVASKRGGKSLKKLLKIYTCRSGEGLSVHQSGKETEEIRCSMSNLTKELESITKVGGPSSSAVDADQPVLTSQTYGHEVEECFVGMKEDIDKLVSYTLSKDRSHRVISICGMGGLGKTTLARKIYQHESCFKLTRAWVCVTQEFEAKAVFQRLLSQLLSKERTEQIKIMEEEELETCLYNLLKEKECLVVVDDIWEVNHWNVLRRAFPITEPYCKILLTTRNEKIADTEFVHKLKCMSEEDSLALLRKIALPINYFQGLSRTDLEQLEKNGKKMVRKCGYLPLAISVIAGILRQKQTYEWVNVIQNMDSYLKHGDGVEKDVRVHDVLNLSYNALPYYLKLCFLYLGCFPVDKEIDAELVYSLWIAEGMVSSEDIGSTESLVDVAERYLSELASRGMVGVTKHKSSMCRRFESFRIHDLIRDLCLYKGERDHFVEVRDFQTGSSSATCKSHRLAINLQKFENYTIGEFECRDYKRFRTLLLLNSDWWKNCVTINMSNFGMFKSIKILILEGCRFKFNELPGEMWKLILLKHLSIRRSYVEELPLSVCKLQRLQYLDLRTMSEIKLPNVVHMLGRLKHLFVHVESNTVGGKKLKLDELTELETLIGFNSTSFDARHIHKLTRLRLFHGVVYDIQSLSMVVAHITDPELKMYETSLTINQVDFNSETGSPLLKKMLLLKSLSYLSIGSNVRKLPAWEPQFCRSLMELYLLGCEIEEDPMGILGNFLVLRILSLGANSFVGVELICRENGFPQLTSLEIQDLSNLVIWRVGENAMPNLSYLRIQGCKKLKMVPDGLRFVTTLQKLEILFMPKIFNDKLRVIDGQVGDDYDKIKHISSITLVDEIQH